MIEYQLLYCEEEPVECDSCQQIVPLAKFDGFHFCELCASSLAGNSRCHPKQYKEAFVLQTVAAVGNLVLLRLEARLDRLERLLQGREEL